jgi:hypothetical protein
MNAFNKEYFFIRCTDGNDRVPWQPIIGNALNMSSCRILGVFYSVTHTVKIG